MKTKKDLAKYLADYVEHERDRLHEAGLPFSVDCYEIIIEQGLEAFESTEQVQVKIIDVID